MLPEIRSHVVRRFSVALPGLLDECVTAFEAAVPALDHNQLAALVTSGADWQEIEGWTRALATHGFLRYWKNDLRSLMAVAGDTAPAVAYLMGNHVTAERMFRVDPRVMNYAPLRVIFTQDASGAAVFTADVPSDHFGAFDVARITEVGVELDGELQRLLRTLGAAPVDALRPGS